MRDASKPILKIENLKTWFKTNQGTAKAVDGVSFDVHEGDIWHSRRIWIGQKCYQSFGAAPYTCSTRRHAEGKIVFRGKDLLKVSEEEIRMVAAVRSR